MLPMELNSVADMIIGEFNFCTNCCHIFGYNSSWNIFLVNPNIGMCQQAQHMLSPDA
jgi:hypothetical protein